VRNLLNFRNVLQVFAVNGDVRNDEVFERYLDADLDDLEVEADANGVRGADGEIDLRFGGVADPRTQCGNWVSSKGEAPAAANCVYLIRAEERYGNGDHIFTVDEQTRASDALYEVTRGLQAFTGAPRRVRLGIEVSF